MEKWRNLSLKFLAKYPPIIAGNSADTFGLDASFIKPLRRRFRRYIANLLQLLRTCQNRQEITAELTIPELLLTVLPAIIEPSLSGRALLEHLQAQKPEIPIEKMLSLERIRHRIRFLLAQLRK